MYNILTLAKWDGLELSNLVFGMCDENCNKVERFLVTDLASRANLLSPVKHCNIANIQS